MIRKKRLFPRITHRFLMLIAAGLLLLSYLSAVVDPAKVWYMSVFGLLFIPLMLLNLGLLVWAVLRRSKSFIFPLIALIPSILTAGWYLRLPTKSSTEDGVTFLSYNVGQFNMSDRDSGIEDQLSCEDSVCAFVNSSGADIICLQEFFVSNDNDIHEELCRRFPDYHSEYFMASGSDGYYGNVTLSRFPIVNKGKFNFRNSANLAIFSDCVVEGDTVRIYNCHFESYNISLTRLAKSLGNDKTIVRETETKAKNSITRRPKQVDEVLSHIRGCELKAFVAGDFNDNPLSYTYFRLRKGRKDTFTEKGSGFGATYSVLRPFLRIDYILFPPEYSALSHKVLHKPYSDHYPIIANIKTN